MKEIHLTQGKVALVDDEDFEWLNRWKWYAQKDKNTYYAKGWIESKAVRMHHLILGKPFTGYMFDHRDGNGLNNQRENLHFATNRQNCQNRKNINKSSRYPGVCWHRARKKWQATIYVNGKQKYLGIFVDERDAFNVYRQAVEALGEKMVNETL